MILANCRRVTGIGQLARAGRKLAFPPIAGTPGIGQLIQTAPIFRAGLGNWTRWRNAFHRWQADTLQGLDLPITDEFSPLAFWSWAAVLGSSLHFSLNR